MRLMHLAERLQMIRGEHTHTDRRPGQTKGEEKILTELE
jgi:hypothetical protein